MEFSSDCQRVRPITFSRLFVDLPVQEERWEGGRRRQRRPSRRRGAVQRIDSFNLHHNLYLYDDWNKGQLFPLCSSAPIAITRMQLNAR
jgi:hypothetical protein